MAFNTDYFKMMPPVTKNLIIVNLLIFVVMAIMPASKVELIYQYGGLHYFSSPSFNWAQLITYMFIHGGFAHFFFNMFALFMFGPQIEWTVGSRRFLFYYMSCGIGAGLLQEGVYALMINHYQDIVQLSALDWETLINKGARLMFYDPTVQKINALVHGLSVGASGAIYGVLLAFGMLFPDREIMLLIPPMPIKAKWMVIAYGVIELVLAFASPGDNVAHLCHIGGMVFGFFIILYWKKKGTIYGRF